MKATNKTGDVKRANGEIKSLRLKKSRARHNVKAKRKNAKAGLNTKSKAKAEAAKIKPAKRKAAEVGIAENVEGKSFEEILENRIISNKTTTINAPNIHEVIYNATPSMKEIAYKSGFSFGKSLYEKGKDLQKLIAALETAGLKNVLYYPFEDKAIIRAKPESSYSIGRHIHIFESGVIAGFMSAHSEKIMYAYESKCTFNGEPYCEFVVEPRASLKPAGGYDENVVEEIADLISKEKGYKLSQEYMLFSMLPILKEPIKDEVSKLFYVVGSRLGRSRIEPSVLGEKLGIKATNTKKGIMLQYNSINSTKGFVDVSSAMFAGLAKALYNKDDKNIEIKQSTENGAYKVYISFKQTYK